MRSVERAKDVVGERVRRSGGRLDSLMALLGLLFLLVVLDVVPASYSVIVFATLAGSIGAFFLSDRSSGPGRDSDKHQ